MQNVGYKIAIPQSKMWWYGRSKKKGKLRHLHCPCTLTEGPEEPGAQNCIQPRCAPCGHHVCMKSQPWGQHHWWCFQGVPPAKDGNAPHWMPEGPQWFVSVRKRTKLDIKLVGKRIYIKTVMFPKKSYQGITDCSFSSMWREMMHEWGVAVGL